MKKIILVFFLIFTILHAPNLYGNDQISVSLSQDSIELGDMLTLEVRLDNLGNISDVQIPGLENFQVFSRGKQSQFQSINGEVQNSMIYSYQIQALAEGSYSLGPVRLVLQGSDVIQDDEILALQVGEGSASPLPTESTSLDSEDDAGEASSESTETTENISDDTSLLDAGERSQKLESLRDLRRSHFPVWIFMLLILSFLGVFYFLLSVFFQWKKSGGNTQLKTIEAVVVSHGTDGFKSELEGIEANIETLSTQEFYKKLQDVLRRIIGDSLGEDIGAKTLQELSSETSISRHPLFPYLKRVYEAEYSQLEMNHSQKQEFVQQIITQYSQIG